MITAAVILVGRLAMITTVVSLTAYCLPQAASYDSRDHGS